MRRCWKLLRVSALIATLSLTTAVPAFANDGTQNASDSFQTNRIKFTDLIVSSLTVGPLPAVIVLAVQKVREAV